MSSVDTKPEVKYSPFTRDKALLFIDLLLSYLPVSTLQSEIAHFADSVANQNKVGVYYVGSDPWVSA